MDFVAVDFETANEKRNSPCAIGLVIVENGRVVRRIYSLIRPPTSYFSPFNVGIHGITWEDVKDKPEFDRIFPKMAEVVGGKILVAHNASFDVSVLRATLDYYEIQYPEISYACTMVISRNLWPGFLNYRLPTIADFLGIDFQHHKADEDALACASICMKACNKTNAPSIPELTGRLSVTLGHLYRGGYTPIRSPVRDRRHTSPEQVATELTMPARDVDSENPACGRIFVFTGTLQSMTRPEATAKLIAAGGKCVSSVSDKVHFLVMGEQDLRQLHGETKSRKARSAQELIADGVNIEVIGEKDFLEMLTPEPQGENNEHDHSTGRGCRKSP